jgi:hypothetical protein
MRYQATSGKHPRVAQRIATEMASVIHPRANAIVSQAILDSRARTFVPTFAAARESAPLEDVFASQALLEWIAQSKRAAVAMEIAQSPAPAFAIQGLSVTSARWPWNVPIPPAVDMALATREHAHA